ncbi:hypothetical protein [Nannocystis punicea]|uniref:Uncharacterized protein n=1 Tax=Nannocystis punicea TaxID=2995304 RepID=A0ABY7GY93_9BACT|nr:hypothetical protein [Nannocystis poenicansa]WAS91794.1 hypothetical protein O0S08_36895 [Nannocystis poenicansa]
MRFAPMFSLAAVVLSFGAVTLGGARDALAVPCCGSSICQQEVPPPICFNCTPTCADEEENFSSEEVVYDEVDAVCLVPADVESSPCDAPQESTDDHA